MAKHVVVIGGGLAGTSAAYWLTRHGYKVTVAEKNDQLGGRIHSKLVDGAAVEMGAGFITGTYTNLLGFLAENSLRAQLYQHKSSLGTLRDGHVITLTPGALLGGTALSWSAKTCAARLLLRTIAAWPRLTIHDPGRAAAYDSRPVSEMFSGAGGAEFVERVLQPIVNGYCYWEPEHTSEAMMLLLSKLLFSRGSYKMRGGLQRIPEKAAAGSTVLLGHEVLSIRESKGKYSVTVRHKNRQTVIEADGIVCATTASAVPAMFPSLSEQQKEFFGAVSYSSTALLAQTYEAGEAPGCTSVAFPRQEGTDLSSVTLSPEPGPLREAALATIKIYASGASSKRLAALADGALPKTLVGAAGPVLSRTLIGTPQPIAIHVQRWPEALPYYDVGYFGRLRQFENGEIESPGQAIAFAGDYLSMPCMEGAFTSGMRAAERLDKHLSTQRAQEQALN